MGAPHNDKIHHNTTMKKTLFAMLALATMLPAMAENWKLRGVYVDPYEDILTPSPEYTNPDNYTFYLMAEENTDLYAVQTELEGKTFSDFTTTIASGDGVVFEYYSDNHNQLCRYTIMPTDLSSDIELSDIWGVCVLQDTDVVRFQVVPVEYAMLPYYLYFDTEAAPGSGYTTFSSVPEPATATLSLLALAGLATRRRRK